MPSTPTYILHDDDLYKVYSRDHIEIYYDNRQCSPELTSYDYVPRAIQSRIDDEPGLAPEGTERVSDD